MKKILLGFCLCLSVTGVKAQDIQAFYDKLEGKTNFYEIMQIVDDEYNNLPQEIRDSGGEGYKKEKHWRRWEQFMSSHLGADGELVRYNQLNQDALKSLNKNQKTTNSSWAFIGPSASSYQSSQGYCIGNGLGRVDRIAFHPSDANIIYAGMPAGGLWRTTNGGTSWTALTDYIPSLGISGIAVSHSNANTIYVLSGDGDSDITGGFVNDFGYIRESAGVFKSTDNGETWQQTGTLSNNSYVGYELVMDPNNANTLFAATSDGLYKTTNGGTSWTQVRTGRIYDVNFKPGSSTRVYCATNTSFQYSNDGGSSWSNATYSTSPPSGRKSITVTNDNSNVVYLLCGGGVSNGVFGGFYRSTNSGSSFTRQTNTPNILDADENGTGNDDASDYILCAAADHSDEDMIVMGSLICFRSTNKGVTWTNSSTYWEDGGAWYVHPDIHEMKYNPLDNKVYVGHDGGIHVSSDDGQNWTDITSGIRATQSYHIDQFPGTTSLLIGNQDNGLKRRSSGGDFPHVASGDGFYPAFDQNDQTRFFSSINTSLYLFSNSGSSRSGQLRPNSQWYKTVTFHNTNSSIVLCGSNDIFKSTNTGASWNNEGASGSWAITRCPSNNNRFYATGLTNYQPGSGSAYVSSDAGDTWTNLGGNTGFPSTITKITDIRTPSDNSTKVWITMGGYNSGSKVYYSTNTGSTWTNMSGSLPNVPVHCIAITDTDDAFVGTDVGVFYRSASMSDWIPWSNGLPNVPITDIRLDPNAGAGNIYISTFGRGVWFDNIPDNICETDKTVAGNLDGYDYYEVTGTLSSSSEVEGTTGVEAYYKAGDKVVLTPGFHAQENSVFRAYLGPCGSGGIPSAQEETEIESSKRNSEEGDGESIAFSKFDIQGNTLECYIKERKGYVLKIVDESLNEYETLYVGDLEDGTHRLEVNLEEYRSANQLYFVALFDKEMKHYLQEIE